MMTWNQESDESLSRFGERSFKFIQNMPPIAGPRMGGCEFLSTILGGRTAICTRLMDGH